MGIAIGTAIATTFDQIFLNTPLRPIAWLVPSLVVAAIVGFQMYRGSFKLSKEQNHLGVYAIMAAVILGHSDLLHGNGIALLVLAGGFHFSRNKTPLVQKYILFLTAATGLFCIRLFRPLIEYGTWRLRPLYTGTDDLVFSESISNSLSHFGLSDHAAAVGTTIRYHWFSLAWSGFTSRVAGSEPFDVTLHLVPVAAFLGISCLAWSIVLKITSSKITSTIVVLIIFATDSLPEQIRFFYVLNTSNTLSHIWVLMAILIFLRALETQQKRWLFIFPASIAVTLLAKSPYGAVLLIAALTSLVYCIFFRPKFRIYAAYLVGVSLLIALMTYLKFLSPNAWEKRSFEIGFNPFHFTNPSIRTSLITLIFVAAIYITRMPVSHLIFSKKDSEFRAFYVFLGAGALAGLARFVFDGDSAEQYFLNSALIYGAVLSSCSIHSLVTIFSTNHRKSLTVMYCTAAATSAVTFKYFFVASFLSHQPLGANLSLLLIPILSILIAVVFLISLRSKIKPSLKLIQLFVIVALIGTSTGIFFLKSISQDTNHFTETVASTTDLKALNWIHENVPESDVLATNRFLCNPDPPCNYDDSSFLISAVSGRRVLIEGPRFVIGGRPFPDWANKRIQLSIAFANSPTDPLFSELQKFEVKWFYIDTKFMTSRTNPNLNPWASWSVIAFRDANIYILKLKE